MTMQLPRVEVATDAGSTPSPAGGRPWRRWRPVAGLPWRPRARRPAGSPAGPAQTGPALARLMPVGLVLAAAAVVGLDLDVPVLRPAAALGLLVALPVLVLHRRGRLPADTAAASLLTALGLTVLGLLLGGLLLDTVLPVVGVDRPLAPLPIASAALTIDLALLAWRRHDPLLPAEPARRALRAAVSARLRTAPTLAVLALLLSVAGAVRLNNGATGAVAVAAGLVGAAALVALLSARDAQSTPTRDAWVLGLVGAGLLLATSLRGWTITGHDIWAEYLAFRLTDDGQDWVLAELPSAYNACLSVTILPALLVQAGGLPAEPVFKVLLQLLFATVPVLTYLLARRMVHRRLAVAAAVFTLAFPTFSTDMPYLVRQEVAFFFLALMLLAATEPGRSPWITRGLVLLFGVGVVLSHYSTTYVLLMALLAALAGLAVLGLVRRMRGARTEPGPPLTLLHPLVVAALVVATLAWAGPITGTGGHAREVLRETLAALAGAGETGPGSSDTSYWILGGDDTTPRERMDLFVEETLAYRDARIPEVDRVLPDPGERVLSPELRDEEPDRLTALTKLGSAALMQAFALLGVGWLLRRKGSGSFGRGPSREVAFLTWGAMGALGLIVVVPNLSVDYGVLRAFQQTLLVIAPTMAIGMWLALRPLGARLPRLGRALTVAAPVLLVVAMTGVLPSVLGSRSERMALGSSGTYYDRLFSSDASVEAMGWLGAVDRADRTNERLIASRNVNVRLLALSDNRAPVADRLFPTLLSNDGYVFVDAQIVERGESTVFYTGDLLTYRYPLESLDRRLDLVYSGPDARIYR